MYCVDNNFTKEIGSSPKEVELYEALWICNHEFN